MKTYKFTSGLKFNECEEILNENRWKFRYNFSSEKKYFIRKIGSFFYSAYFEGRNSWAIYFFGKLEGRPDSTIIKGFFFLHPYTIILTLIIFSFLLYIFLITDMDIEVLIITLPFIIISAFGIFTSRKHPELIIKYIKELFKAEVDK